MTETTSPQEELQQDTQVMPGDLLKEGRERKDISTEEVAKQLNLKHAFVVQMEANDFDQLPGATFIRGYLRAYSKLVGLDAEPVISAFNNISTEEKKPESRYKPKDTIKPQRNFSDPLIKYTTLIVVAALIGLSIMWWQSRSGLDPISLLQSDTVTVETSEGETVVSQMDLTGADSTTPASEAATVDESGDASITEESGTESVEGVETLSDDVSASEQGSSVETESAVETEVSSTETASENASVQANTNAAANNETPEVQVVSENTVVEAVEPEVVVPVKPVSRPDPGPVPVGLKRFVINYAEECWVEITDARGIRVVNNLKKSGEQSLVTGLPPFKLMIGNAGGAELIYDDQVVDLKPHTNRNNIARMTLGKVASSE
jgi:cytoskeleton protein RodZ